MAEIFSVTVSRGAEEALVGELRRMGLQRVVGKPGVVRFRGPLADGFRACLWSRVGSRVLLQLARFPASDADGLYAGVSEVPWEEHIRPGGSLWVDFVGGSRAIRNSRFGAQKTKDAIVDRMRDQGLERPEVQREDPHLRINVHLRDGVATVGLDLSGRALHWRTPGRHVGKAPLRETLAGAVLQIADWPRKAREGWSLTDPMCGSGTFLLEACGMAQDLAPGLSRQEWGFTHWLGFDARTWKELREEAQDRRADGRRRNVDLRGMDKDPKAVLALSHNADILGLEGITTGCQELAEMRAEGREQGMVVTNPPYGERLEEMDLPALYGELGNVLRRHMLGWEAWILAPAGPLSRSVGLKTTRRHPLFNGPLECRLLQFEIDKTAPRSR